MVKDVLIPVDMNDPVSALNAELVEWPATFSKKAWECLRYFDVDSNYSTIFLFRYKGKLIATDESLYLTNHGDGFKYPLGGPRGEFDTMESVEEWLELVHDEVEYDGFNFETMKYEGCVMPWED